MRLVLGADWRPNVTFKHKRIHSRLAVGEALRPYTMARHKAWLLRQRLES